MHSCDLTCQPSDFTIGQIHYDGQQEEGYQCNVLPFTMNDFDEEEDGHDDDSQSPDRFTAADEESIKSKATQAACLDASAVYSA